MARDQARRPHASSLVPQASVSARLAAQTAVEVQMTLRRSEGLLVNLVIPVGVLLFASAMLDPPAGYARAVDFALPGVLALAVMSAGMVSLAIATAYERFYRVLKRLGTTPLSRLELIVAKIGGVLVVEVLQVAALAAIAAVVLGWRPAGTAWAALPLLALGTVLFTGLGLLMAGALRAEATLGLANALYLAFAGLGGIVAPLERLPDWIAEPARLLPATALARALRAVLAEGAAPTAADLVVLVAWTIAAIALTARTFHWE